MDSDLIDLIYQNEAVEGIAIFDANNNLVENQLSLNLNKATAIAATLVKLKNGLNNAGREMRGFLIKTSSILLLVNMYSDKLILLEISEGFSVNEVEGNLRSILGEATDQPVVKTLPAHPAQQAAVTPAEEEMVDGIDLADFKSSLSKLLKTVAPGKLAETMINKAMNEMGIDEQAVQLPQDQATKLGYEVIARVPNKARRKIIENEYTTMLNQ